VGQKSGGAGVAKKTMEPERSGNGAGSGLNRPLTVSGERGDRFYHAACNADAVKRGEFCPSVRLSVRLSVTRVNCDKTEERFVHMFIPYERTFSLVF